MSRFHIAAIALAAAIAPLAPAAAGLVEHVSTIDSVYPLADGSFIIIFDDNAAACPNTKSRKYHFVAVNQLGVTEQAAKQIYAAALLALATDKQVRVYFDDSTPYCWIDRLRVMK